MIVDPAVPSLAAQLAGRRRTQTVAPTAAVESAPLFADCALGRRIDAAPGQGALPGWYAAHRLALEPLLHRHGALLLRGFSVAGVSDFGAVVEALGRPLDYTYRSTPRTELGGGVYTSTEYPASERIPLHNENSYAADFPALIAFHCEVPPGAGGATPIADSRAVYQGIDPAIRERFGARGVLYVRNFAGLDLDWRTAFQTNDRRAVDRFCRAAGIAAEWHPDGTLTTRQTCPAARAHPATGEMVWFNQAHLFHISALPELVAGQLLSEFGEQGLPRNAYYGDGSAIEPDALAGIREVYARCARAFPWQAGDVLILDNLLCAHGREPFSGARRVLVGMTGGADGTEL